MTMLLFETQRWNEEPDLECARVCVYKGDGTVIQSCHCHTQ